MKKNIFDQLDMLSRIVLLMLIIGLFTFLNPGGFFTQDNLSAVIFQQAPFTILMSLGMSLAIITKGIDKSMASVMVLSTILSAESFKNGNFAAGLVIALAVGVGCGVFNGVLITRVGIQPFIATYGVDFVTLGLAYVICNGQYVYEFPSSFRWIANGTVFFGVPNIAVFTVLIFFVLYILTRKTIWGRGMYSAGMNAKAANLSGIRTGRIITQVYIINGLLAATAGIFYMARLNAADPGIGGTLTLDSIAASLVGGNSFGGGKGSVSNTIIGALIILFIRNGMNIMNISINWQSAVIGMIIIFSIFYEMVISRMIKMKG